jgi:ATP-dependent helicase/nuclease subunit A
MLKAAMNILEKNLLILASAGSGKTFQLGNRVIGLVIRGVQPERIVALTFTRKAAGEFADSVLNKLAQAASDPKTAAKLRQDLKIPDADFSDALERVVRALPRLTLGTMDSFFAKVVRGFQYELGLTGGRFDLLEGPRSDAAADDLISSILAQTLDDEGGKEFMQAFRRATIGRELPSVQQSLREFIKIWHERYQSSAHLTWGPHELAQASIDDWEKQKHQLAEQVLCHLDSIEYTMKGNGQRDALHKAVETLRSHTIGSGSLSKIPSLLERAMKSCAEESGSMTLKFRSEFVFHAPGCDALRKMILLAAHCEFAAALIRTRAVREVISVYDSLCEKQLRKRGLLGFGDVKWLMGQWAASEDARLRRDTVDFRLDARYDHWLLDEFQDTSRADWLGLQPLIDEASGDGDGSVFIVGDRKQAIYAWRGGEVTLFDEVLDRYHGAGIIAEPLTDSWRSCPQVLELVNQVCGDKPRLLELFGDVANRWIWDNHTSSPPLQKDDNRGEARVESVEGKWEDRLERLPGLLDELDVGKREMTCGILVRSNSKVREISDKLRAHGFDVIEDGRRKPAEDHPVGIAINHLLQWLATPSDSFAWEVVEMSPLAAKLREKYGTAWQSIWEALLANASENGFAAMVEEVVEMCWENWSNFGRRRAGDIIMALAALDSKGGSTIREAADWVKRLEVSQNPGAAAVQVMTIHKSKGLGFDLVVLPDIPNQSIPSAQHFEIAEGDGWLSETPPKWSRELIPHINQAEALWSNGQCYENFCMLYVALTRAKRGLYILLEPRAEKAEPDKPSLDNWLASCTPPNPNSPFVSQIGTPDWIEGVDLTGSKPNVPAKIPLGSGIPRRERTTPSSSKTKDSLIAHSAKGMIFGNEVHQAFEQVGWIDESTPSLSRSEAATLVAETLRSPSIRPLFERNGRNIDLFREQAIDATSHGTWLSGIIDRLHLHRDASGNVHLVEIIDFKTDAVESLDPLVNRYSSQMNAYRDVLKTAYPNAVVRCLLVSTRCRDCIEV